MASKGGGRREISRFARNDGRGKPCRYMERPGPERCGTRHKGRSMLRPYREHSIGHHEVNEGAQGHAGGAFGEPRLGVVVPSGTGAVQVDPRRLAGEFLDEHGAGNGAAAFAAADILYIGEG